MSSTYEQINHAIAREYEAMGDAEIIAPEALAFRVFESLASGDEDARIQYVSVEHLKQMARAFLRRNNDPDSDESPAYESGGDLFSGTLQHRYPVRGDGGQHVYKLRYMLTEEERAMNVERLRKSAGARLKHADALEAEGASGIAAA